MKAPLIGAFLYPSVFVMATTEPTRHRTVTKTPTTLPLHFNLFTGYYTPCCEDSQRFKPTR